MSLEQANGFNSIDYFLISASQPPMMFYLVLVRFRVRINWNRYIFFSVGTKDVCCGISFHVSINIVFPKIVRSLNKSDLTRLVGYNSPLPDDVWTYCITNGE